MYTDEWTEVDLYRRDDLTIGDTVTGPAIIAEANATTVLDPGWSARVTEHNHLMLERTSPRRQDDVDTEVDPVMLELFNNLFMSIAEQMGERLRHRQLGEHQGAVGLLVRPLRPRRPPDRQCAPCPSTWARRSRSRRSSPRTGEASDPETPTCSTTLITAEPICRHNRGHTGLRPSRRASSTSRPGATTPRSAASHRARCRRSAPRSTRREC